MGETERLAALMALTAEKLSKVEALGEIILKSQAHFLANVAEADWKEIHEDLLAQVEKCAASLHKKSLMQWDHLRRRSPGEGSGGPPEGRPRR